MTLDLPGTFAAGLLTFLSPCVLPLLPIYLGLLAGASVREVREGEGSGRLVATATAFALGLGSVFVALGLAATAAGRMLSHHRTALLQVGGAVIGLLGLRQLGLLRIALLERERRPLLGRIRGGGSLAGAFAFGAAFALGWTPCVGPVLGAVLTYAASASASPARGALLLGAYASGLGLPLVAVAALAPRALAVLDRVKPHLRKLELATGFFLVAAGGLLATDRLSMLVPHAADAAIEPPRVASPPGPPAASAACASPADPSGAACTAPRPQREAPLPVIVAAVPKGPAVVEIVSERCPACARMEPVVAQARRRCAGRHLRIERSAAETPEGAALVRRHGIRGVPTFLLLDETGAEVGRLVGEQPLATLERAMIDLTAGRCAVGDDRGHGS